MLNFSYTPYALPLIGTAIIASLLCLYAWRHRKVSGAIPFALLTFAITEWSLTYALEIAGADLPTKIFWGQIQYFGIVTAPLAWLLFALQYTHREKWLTYRNIALISLEPLITVILAFTTQLHGLIWNDMSLNRAGQFLALDVSHGSWFWVHTAYSYGLMLAGTLLLLRWIGRLPELYRNQAGALLIGVITPWLGNIIYISGLNPWPLLDITPFSLTLTSLMFGWAIFRLRLLDLAPLARDVVVENLRDGMIVLDTQNRIVDLNPAAARMLNVTTASVIGQPMARLLVAWPHVIERYRSIADVRDEVSVTVGGAHRDFELEISALVSARQQMVGRVIVVRDITERKQAAENLSRYNQRLSGLYDIAVELLKYTEVDRLLQLIVDRAAVLLEAPYVEILLADGDELVVQAYTANQPRLLNDRVRRAEARLSWQAFDARQPITVAHSQQWPARRAGYAGLELHAVASIPIQFGEKCLGVLDLARDKPGYFFDEEQLRFSGLFAQLVALVLSNAQLYTQNLDANRLKSRLLANVSHDVRTPLSVVLLHTSMLNSGLHGPITPKQNKALTSIASAANLILDFVNNLIGQAEIESGQVRLEMTAFSPNTLVETIYAIPKELAHMKGVELSVEIAPGLPNPLWGDLYRLRQVLLNLVSNAVKFTQQGQVSVRLYQPGTARWAIEVADTGVGIPAEAQGYIFNAFQQIEDPNHQAHLGSGLGLSIVKELTSLMGGQIALASEVGRGSVFTVTLPLLTPMDKENGHRSS
jgi:PAS domain S-box-containing protein